MKYVAIRTAVVVIEGEIYNLHYKNGRYIIGNTGFTVAVNRLSYWFKPIGFKYGK